MSNEEVKVGKVYRDMGGNRMLALREVPANEVGLLLDPSFTYVEVVFADRPDHSDGYRRKIDGRYPLYVSWPKHPCHLILRKTK